MNKKFFWIFAVVLLLFAGIVALTQEAETTLTARINKFTDEERTQNPVQYISINELSGELPDWIKPLRWFRSNQGGMSIEEAPSSSAALRNDYALSIGFTRRNELPQSLVSFYNDEYFIEVRTLYEKGKIVRRQWLLKERNGITRLNAVIIESSSSGTEQSADENDSREKRSTGFIEVFDNASCLISEYNFYEDDENTRTDYVYKEGMLISAIVSLSENEEYVENYGDFFKYNRASFLRSVERVFYKDRKISLSGEILSVSFPRKISDAVNQGSAGERINSYPGFFGEVHIEKNNRIVYVTDERSRIVSQTLYDDYDNVVWVIHNTWSNDRITATKKTEGDTEYLAEFEYNSDKERILERNFKNGVLERLVRTNGKTEIEELYLNNVVVLRAVWEDGRKISETRNGIR